MLKYNRIFVSITLLVALLVPALFLSKPSSIKACPPPPPETLFGLYLKSDLIVVADVKSEKDGKITIDENDYFYVEVIRNLQVSSILKGKTAKSFVFTKEEYRPKNETAESAENKEIEEEADNEYYPFGYNINSKLKQGERYLFFFKKDAETGAVELTDSVSGVKKLNNHDLAIHQKRINELKEITKSEKNQLAQLTEWFIRCIEEPSTRWDGVSDLTMSFEALEYETDSEESEEKKQFVIDENFYSQNSVIAENMSDSQKEYISSVYFSLIQSSLLKDDADDFYDNFSNLVSRWDKPRIATYAYSILQNVEQSNFEKTGQIINFISTIIGDEELNEISTRYTEIDSENASEEIDSNEKTVEVKTEIIESNKPENAAEEAETVEKVEQVENAQAVTAKEAAPQKLTPAQMRGKVLQEFRSRYERLLVSNFAVETEAEVAEINQK
jgi:hypothetical protein